MTDNDLLTLTKSNLQLITNSFDSYLNHLISVAKKSIAEEGITLDLDDVEDCNLIIMYSAYLYAKRMSDETKMPRMLRYALNNRLFAEKGGV